MKKIVWLLVFSFVIVLFPKQPFALTTSQADKAMNDYLNVFWDSNKQYFFTYSDHIIHSEHAVGPENGLYTDYWWEAQLFEMALDRYERAPSEQAKQLVADIYDGFKKAYPDFRKNDWNDDIGWWARGTIRAYELTKDDRYLAASKEMLDYISQYRDDKYGGGIWWKNVDIGNGDKNEKNVATNATATYTALRIYAITKEQKYLDLANELFAWMDNRFYNNGHVLDHIAGNDQMYPWDWTYNNGNYAGAALEMYLQTKNETYLTKANTAVEWAINNLTSSGTLLYEGRDDTSGFKAILTRNIRALIDKAGQTQYENFLTENASQAANHLNSLGIGGPDWLHQTDTAEPIQSLAAAASVAIMQQAAPDGKADIVPGTGVYQAENAYRDQVDSETTWGGHHGRGYVAGWNKDKSAVTFYVQAAEAKNYILRFRYSAAAGEAKRTLLVNSAAAKSLPFVGTSTWDDWKNTDVTVPLQKGENKITLQLNEAAQDSNYLNLDELSLH